jgi:Putative peptidoglycan binding domain
MLGDGTIGSWWRKVWPLGARRDKPPANDAMFIDVMADFSRQLSERVARQSATGLASAQQERREALRALDRKRRRQQMLTAGVAAGALVALGIASLAPPTAPPVAAPQPVAAAPTEPSPPVMVAAAQPTVLPDSQPAAPAPEPAPSSTAAPAAAVAAPEPLRGEEVREVQKRLQRFGFNPGPADGVAGRMTAAAVMNYQLSRGQPHSGDIDRDLLEQLRQDPAPQVAPPPPVVRTAQRAPRPTRSPNPFDQLGRWLDSLVR